MRLALSCVSDRYILQPYYAFPHPNYGSLHVPVLPVTLFNILKKQGIGPKDAHYAFPTLVSEFIRALVQGDDFFSPNFRPGEKKRPVLFFFLLGILTIQCVKSNCGKGTLSDYFIYANSEFMGREGVAPLFGH